MKENVKVHSEMSKKTDTATIFISIASYCDSLLQATIEGAYAQAIYPERLRFGVVEQTDLAHQLPVASMPQSKQIRYLAVDRLHSRGAGWARNVAMSLYQEEDWFFQIDSHMLFSSGWDITMLERAEECAEINPQFVISSYPNPFNFVDGVPTPQPVTDKILAHVVRGDCDFDACLNLGFIGSPVNQDTPVRGFHLGAGCLFAPGKFVSAFPYDAQIYFLGEEQALAARLFTHGWDIFHVSGMPIYHLYETAENPSRPKHWSVEENTERVHKWDELSTNSRLRVDAVLLGQSDFGVYGLGQQRTMEEFAEFSGIDYKNKKVSEVARKGYWAKDQPVLANRKPPKRSINIVEYNPFTPRPFVFSDVSYYLYKSLQSSGANVRHIHKPIDDDSQINIVIGAGQSMMDTINQLTSKHNIAFNFEQLASSSVIVNEGYLKWLKDRVVFDYHSKNVEFLNEFNGGAQNTFEIPLSTSAELNYFPDTPNTGEVDVLFFGLMSERRAHIIEQFRGAGLSVELVEGAYGRELTPAIKRAKLVLHVHYYETALFPFMRFMQAIPCGIPILCENSIMSANSNWEASGIFFTSYENLVESAIAIIAKDQSERNVSAGRLLEFSNAIAAGNTIKKILADLGWYSEES